jgi:hypothetical protein
MVHKLKLRLSPKAVIITSNDKLTSNLKKQLFKEGLLFSKSEAAKDIGITHTCAKARPSNIQMKKQKESTNRFIKITKIAKMTRKAKKLFTGSAFAKATWGHQAFAISEIKMKELEGDALACSGLKPAGRCRTLGLLVSYGMQGTPRARVVRESMRAWIALLANATPSEILNIRVVWPKARDYMLSHKCRINTVARVMSNILHILISAKWIPRTSNFWTDDVGNGWAIVSHKVAPDIVAQAITKSYFNHNLPRASLHHNGKGIENGIDINNTTRYLKNIKNNDDIAYGFKCPLETIMVGSC